MRLRTGSQGKGTEQKRASGPESGINGHKVHKSGIKTVLAAPLAL